MLELPVDILQNTLCSFLSIIEVTKLQYLSRYFLKIFSNANCYQNLLLLQYPVKIPYQETKFQKINKLMVNMALINLTKLPFHKIKELYIVSIKNEYILNEFLSKQKNLQKFSFGYFYTIKSSLNILHFDKIIELELMQIHYMYFLEDISKMKNLQKIKLHQVCYPMHKESYIQDLHFEFLQNIYYFSHTNILLKKLIFTNEKYKNIETKFDNLYSIKNWTNMHCKNLTLHIYEHNFKFLKITAQEMKEFIHNLYFGSIKKINIKIKYVGIPNFSKTNRESFIKQIFKFFFILSNMYFEIKSAEKFFIQIIFYQENPMILWNNLEIRKVFFETNCHLTLVFICPPNLKIENVKNKITHYKKIEINPALFNYTLSNFLSI